MYFPQFLVGMLTTSGIVSVWAYVATGSFWTAVAWGIIAAILLQVGYFTLVFRLVYGRRDTGKREATAGGQVEPPQAQDETGAAG